MQPLFRALTGVLAAGLLLAGASTPIVEAAETDPPGNASTKQQAIDWKPCPKDATAECGTLRLPVDRARPSGEKFDLAVARRNATDPDRRVGVLLVNPGGPGASGVDFAVDEARSHFSADIQERFDIVGFDPRGVGRSHPVKCSTELLNQQPSVYPRNQAEFDRLAEFNRALREDCRRHTGPLFDHADTLSVVHDMDALREALGEKKINYFGHSYGTLIGEQYAEEYGDRIRSMALTANIDHSLGAREFLVSSAAAAEDSFHQFVKWCERTRSCALHGRDVTAVWDGLLARADRGEISDPQSPDQLLGAHAIALFAFKSFYGPDWDELATYVAGLDAQDPNERRRPEHPRQAQPPVSQDADQQTTSEPFYAVFCQDWSIRAKDYREYAGLTQAEVQAAPHMRGSPRVHAAVAGCIGWPDEVNNPQHRLRITEAPRILMLHSRHDPANHFAWAVNVHRQTRGTTVLLPYAGAGHSVYRRSDCTRDAVDDYLTELRVPSAGSSCAPAGTN
ncbi:MULTISPECIES: alpha/beta fold hydrolase [unclassified Streptomyces]|uniref:alpha/beta fold hydrolase n=1 Tax=unclassified Streptomyces TaxID=2593676 RepID=UPI002366BF57|nr:MULTISPECIES: alpha/beta fold hydrolase [unclassified Streptomyces]MDF3144656.1 alpha/beta fold hydrolase [Streptomyces sp. T21Q-yed]WDF35556.1 alpha/beta fold hydrolase [Streptomyces sp. T12]